MKFDVSPASEILAATPGTVRELLANVSEEWTTSIEEGDLSTRLQDPNPAIQNEEWRPFDIVGHLIHGDETDWIPRARIILAQGNERTFVPFDRFAQFDRSMGMSMVQLLDEFARLRAENLDTLRSWNLTDEQLGLEGIHPELGPVTLRQLLATWVVHDLNHIRQIVMVMSRRYADEVGPWRAYLSVLNG